eukprot:CAMPEP_0201879564 /NCGR_PEP_ID=MMETSP0902-20130614/10414_1 /ASSEMBLY_ACC=CAM_ASM_000551 /TAXON_ID=420261 /ORGANISM="Thalassiosira antarctica, Strain CCMP982" /LENGTH=102 /DNA_ID=CAMNT_0048407421 /DNA_START=1110 /DNA_END=1415 /DNA_ORIENTATION=+
MTSAAALSSRSRSTPQQLGLGLVDLRRSDKHNNNNRHSHQPSSRSHQQFSSFERTHIHSGAFWRCMDSKMEMHGFKNGQRGTCTIVSTSTSSARDQIITVME